MSHGNKGPTIGIDLGTTYSCVGVFQHGKVEIIANDQGNRTTPSYVAFSDTEHMVGDAAKNQAALNSANTIFGAKRLIGRKYNDPTVQGDMKHWPFKVVEVDGRPKVQVEYKGDTKVFAPEELSSMVLTKMKETAEAYTGKTVTEAVITVPAYFNDAQRQATKDAGAIAGLNVLRIINESTAAALAYGLEKGFEGEKQILIFDLGGQTFDLTFLTLDSIDDDSSLFEVRSTAGDMHLGGEDFNDCLVAHFCKEFKREHGKDLNKNAQAVKRLRSACERAKKNLSSSTEASFEIYSLFEGIDFNRTITREKFEELCTDLFSSVFHILETALHDIKLDKREIHEVVLVGGSTKIPRIQELLSDFFNGKELKKSINPDETVAYGATAHAAVIQSGAIKEIVCVNVAPLSLGIETAGGVMTPIIKRFTVVPTREMQTFTTYVDNQSTVDIIVYQGERAMTKDNYPLGRLELLGISPATHGVPNIEVTFDIDANGTLSVTAKDSSTGRTNQIIVMHYETYLNHDQIDRMVSDAEKYKEEDEKQRQCVANKNTLENEIFSVKLPIESAWNNFPLE